MTGVDKTDALSDAAATVAPRLALKWPNDMLLDGAKLAGILVEGETGPPLAAAVGIGVNCAHHPADTAYPATSLAAAGLQVAPTDLIAALSRTMLERQAQWARGDGFPSIRADWLARADWFGRPIHVAVGEQGVAAPGRQQAQRLDHLLAAHAPGLDASAQTLGDRRHALLDVRQ